jgi:hypothetical protein
VAAVGRWNVSERPDGGRPRSRVAGVVPVRANPSGADRLRARRPVLAVALLAALALALAVLASLDPNALCLLPALALAAPLILRRYPGERTLAGLCASPRPRWQRPRSSSPLGRAVLALTPRGGLLLARALAVRPPPASSLTAG